MSAQRSRYVNRQKFVTPGPVPLKVDTVAQDLSDDAKLLLTWLAGNHPEGTAWSDCGLPEDRMRTAYLSLEEHQLVKQLPSAPALVVIPPAVRIAMQPPRYLTSMLGDVPTNAKDRAAWGDAVLKIEAYRAAWGITDIRHAMGGGQVQMHGAEQREAAVDTWKSIHEYRALVRTSTLQSAGIE